MVWNQQVQTSYFVSDGLWLPLKSETHLEKILFFICYPKQGGWLWKLLQVILNQNKLKNTCDWHLCIPNLQISYFSPCTSFIVSRSIFWLPFTCSSYWCPRNNVHIICSPHHGHIQLSSQPISRPTWYGQYVKWKCGRVVFGDLFASKFQNCFSFCIPTSRSWSHFFLRSHFFVLNLQCKIPQFQVSCGKVNFEAQIF